MLRALTHWLRTYGGFAWTFLWVSGARTSMLVFSLLGSIIIYRQLAAISPDMSRAGQFAVSVAVVRALCNSIGGTADLVVLRRVPVLFRTDLAAAGEVVRASFLLRLAMLGVVLAVALLLRSWFAERFLGGADQSSLVLLISAAATGELLLRSVLVVFQATERFDRFVAFEAAFQGGRLVLVLVLLVTGLLDVVSVLIAYTIAAFAAAAIGATQLPRGLFAARVIPARVLRDAAHFFFWTVLGFSLAAATERVDLFLLSRFSGVESVGLYGGVLTLAIIPDFIGGMMVTVLQPRVVKLHESGELLAFNRKLLMVMVPLCVLGMLGIFALADVVVPLALGPLFAPGVSAFVVLACASIFWLMLTPVPAVLITMTAPRLSTALCMLQLLMLISGGYLLVPTYGVAGAAASVAGTRVILGATILMIGFRMMRRRAMREIG